MKARSLAVFPSDLMEGFLRWHAGLLGDLYASTQVVCRCPRTPPGGRELRRSQALEQRSRARREYDY